MRIAQLVVGDGVAVAVSGDEPAAPWIDLRSAAEIEYRRSGATSDAARALAAALVPPSSAQFLERGGLARDLALRAIAERPAEATVVEPEFGPAVNPPSFRDFMVFEEHFRFGYEWRGLPVPDVLYELPVSYAGEPRSVIGTKETVPWPPYTEHLDYELELGIVIGRTGRNLHPDEALSHVAGLVLLNDLSARDVQGHEMQGGLGPSKGKHFASSIGPWIRTLDSIPVEGIGMTAYVDDELWCETRSDRMVWSVAEIVAWASQGETLVPGALLGTGTCNGGSTIEIGRRLESGMTIRFEAEGLGVLENTLGARESGGWLPLPRERAEGRAASLRFLR